MTTARAMGVTRESAAKYSFMLSAPIVLAATVFKLKEFVFSIPFFIGIITSFIVGFFVIKFLLDYLKKGSFQNFCNLPYYIWNNNNYASNNKRINRTNKAKKRFKKETFFIIYKTTILQKYYKNITVVLNIKK